MKKLILMLIALIALGSAFAAVLNEGFDGTAFPPAEWTSPATSWIRNTTTAYNYLGSAGAARAGYGSGNWWLVTPKLRPTAGQALTFWFRDYSDTSGWDYVDEYTYVKISATTDFTGAATLWTGSYTDFTLTYQQATVNIPPAWIGVDCYIAFHHVATGGNWRYVDGVTGVELAPMLTPPNPAVSPNPAHLATDVAINPTLSWSSGGGGPTSYDVYFNGSFIQNQAGTTYTPGILSYSTAYNWQIIPRNDVGPAVGCPTWTFTTRTDPTQPVPYTQNFDGGTTLAGINWSGNMYINATGGNPTNRLTYNLYSSAPSCNAVTCPIGPLPPAPQIKFDYRLMNWSSYPNGGAATIGASDNVQFQISTDGGSNWSAPFYTINSGNHVVSTNYATISAPIPGGYVGSIVWVRILGTWGLGDYYVDIDNFMVMEIPAGPPLAPTLTYPLELTGLPVGGFNCTWSPNPSSGPTDYYNVYFWQEGESIGDGPIWSTTGTTLNPTAPPLDPFGDPQTPLTFNYEDRYYWTVEAYSAGYPEQAAWPTESWFEIQEEPPVITSLPYGTDFEAHGDDTLPAGWERTTLGTGWIVGSDYSSAYWTIPAHTIYAAANDDASNNNSSMDILMPPMMNFTGAGYGAVQLSFDSFYTGAYSQLAYVEISVNDGPWTNIFNVPLASEWTNYSIDLSSYLTSPFRVRFHADDAGAWASGWAIDNVMFEEVVPWDAAPVSIDFPEVNNAVPFIPQATVINRGVNTASFDVTLEIGTWTDTQTVTDLPYLGTYQVNFAQFTPTAGSAYDVYVTTSLTGDMNPGNDTISGVGIFLDLNKPAYGDNTFVDGPCTFLLADPGTITDLPATQAHTNFMPGADWVPGMGTNWWGNDYGTNSFWNIDPVTGTMTNSGAVGVQFNGIAYNPTGGFWYGATSTALYTFDGVNAPVLQANFTWPDATPWAGLMIGIAYDDFLSVLYGVDLGYDAAFTIDPATGICTPMGYYLGPDLNYAQDCAIDQETGFLYLASYISTGVLYWIDTTTGIAYQIGPFQGGAEITGFAIPYTVGGLDVPDVSISNTGVISWPAVAGATDYNVYSSTDPYGPFTYLTNTADLFYDTGLPGTKLFYQVTAHNASLRTARPQIQNNISQRNLGPRVTPNGKAVSNPSSSIKPTK